MRTGRRGCVLALLCALTFVSSCGDGTSEPKVQPGQLALHLTTPHTNDAAVVIQIDAPQPLPTVSAVDAQAFVFSRVVNGATRTVLVGSLASGELLRFAVPDVNQLAAYSVTVLEVADTQNALRADLTPYRAELRVVQ